MFVSRPKTFESCSINIIKNLTNISAGTSALVRAPISVKHCTSKNEKEKRERERKKRRKEKKKRKEEKERKERKGKERKGKERKGKERKGKERKGKERKGKEKRKEKKITNLQAHISEEGVREEFLCQKIDNWSFPNVPQRNPSKETVKRAEGGVEKAGSLGLGKNVYAELKDLMKLTNPIAFHFLCFSRSHLAQRKLKNLLTAGGMLRRGRRKKDKTKRNKEKQNREKNKNLRSCKMAMLFSQRDSLFRLLLTKSGIKDSQFLGHSCFTIWTKTTFNFPRMSFSRSKDSEVEESLMMKSTT